MIAADLIDMRNRLLLADKLVYAVSEVVSPGQAFQVKESAMFYEYFIFATEEDAQAVAAAAGQTLLHVRDAPKRPFRGFTRWEADNESNVGSV